MALTGPEAPLPHGRRQLTELMREIMSRPSAPPMPDPATAETTPMFQARQSSR
jgi:hypothetical protein